mgnify:CR=1 FL=1
MKRFISIILAIVIVLSFAACGKKNDENIANKENETQQVTENKEETGKTENKVEEEKGETEVKPETKPEAKPETKPETKPEAKPETKPETKPEVKPEAKPEVKPEVKPEPAPEPQPETNKSVGNTLLADFKSKANSSSSALSIAEGLLGNSVIKFSGGAMPVEPGYLTGFGNTEITGFKEGAMFAPMIGTIPFVGYVFILEDSANVSSFISTLKSSADLRWNICTSADEMITGNVGNKVFFVMSPINFEE